MSKEICIGDVILYKGDRYVVVDTEYCACSLDLPYDKDYLICREDFVASIGEAVTRAEILRHGKSVTLRDINLNATVVEDSSIYKVRQEKAYSFVQEQAHEVTIFE